MTIRPRRVPTNEHDQIETEVEGLGQYIDSATHVAKNALEFMRGLS